MRTNKILLLSCLFLLVAIPASLSVLAIFYHAEYEHKAAMYFADDAVSKTGLVPSPTVFHFQPSEITAKQREELKNTDIPTEATSKDSNTLTLATAEPIALVTPKEEPTPMPTATPQPTPVKIAKEPTPTPTKVTPTESPVTPTPTPTKAASNTTTSEKPRTGSAVVVESPSSSVIVESNVGTQSNGKVCAPEEFC